jgi:transglutaminase-like putative cysteine protease
MQITRKGSSAVRSKAAARWSTAVLGLIVGFFGWFPAAHAARALYAPEDMPAWVKPIAADLEAPLPEGGAANGSWLLLLDRQYNIRADGHDLYQHSVTRVTSSGGVDEHSTINLEVDPTYQTLAIHSLKVIRDGHVNEQLHSARITALPQETELREKIYNGGYNINVLLSDVRVGDVIDYAYTIHSRERIFPGQFSTRMSIGWDMPIHQLRVSILAPASRELSHRLANLDTAATETRRGELRELVWEWHDLAAKTADADRPRWYAAWPSLQVSSSRSWADVAAQAAPLFVVNERPSAELRSEINAIRKAGGSPEEQTLHALQFVQDKIRYVSISIGPGGFRPSSPNTVLSRRFGDCKDKSLLLVTILRQLGIDADPVLVNTYRGRVLNEALPAPYSFDHAIARVRIGGQTFWADGTADEEFSPLSTHARATYGWGLVLNQSTTALAYIPGPLPDGSVKNSEVVIDLSKGVDAPGKLEVATSYGGKWADEQRDELANDNPQKRRSDYANYMADNYPDAKMSAPIDINDDKVHNIVKVTERYDLPRTFTMKDGRKEFFLQPDEMYRYASRLKSSVRSTPLAIPYPADVHQTIRVILPRKWGIEDDSVQIDNPAFHYASSVRYTEAGTSPELVLDYQYQALSDVVEVAALAQYLKDRRSMDDDLGYTIREPRDPPNPGTVKVDLPKALPIPELLEPITLPADVRWIILIALICGGLQALRRGYRWDPATKWIDPSWPVGIRGWLIPFAILTVSYVFVWLFYLRLAAAHLDVHVWARRPGDVRVVLLWFTIVGVLIEIAIVLTAVLFFKRRSSVPALVIGTRSATWLFGLTLRIYLAAEHLLGDLTVSEVLWDAKYSWILPAVFFAYFTCSKRVKATFVQRSSGRSGTKVATATQAVELPSYK